MSYERLEMRLKIQSLSPKILKKIYIKKTYLSFYENKKQ